MKNSELIKELRGAANPSAGQVFYLEMYTRAADKIEELEAKLEAQPFDVLQHLRDGGKVVHTGTTGTPYMHMSGGKLLTALREEMSVHVLMTGDWQPYHEPAAEGSREQREPKDGELRFITRYAYEPKILQQYIGGEWQNVPLIIETPEGQS